MGICNSSTSTSKSKPEEIIEDQDLNYEWTPEETLNQPQSQPTNNQKDTATKQSIYRINAILYDHIVDKLNRKKLKKILVCKYLFIDQYGKCFTQVPRKESKDQIKIEGSIDRKGLLRLKKIEHKIEGTQITSYEGNISRRITHLQIDGFASTSYAKADDSVQSEKFAFSLDFSKTEWIVEFPIGGNTFINAFLELNDNDNHISAISGVSFQEDKGFAVWKGIENEKRDITLTQQYIEDLRIVSEDAKKVFYQGRIDRINKSIEGTIQGKDMDLIKFKIYMKRYGKGKGN
jgi:hypothetical protein